MNTDPMCRAHELSHPAPPGPLYAESSTVEHHHRRFHIDIQRFSVDSLSQSNNGKDFFHRFRSLLAMSRYDYGHVKIGVIADGHG